MRHHLRRAIALAVLTTILPALLVGVSNAKPAAPETRSAEPQSARQAYAEAERGAIKVDLLGINDFHGNLEPISKDSSSGVINATPAGGAEYLATQLDRLRARASANGASTITIGGGDLVGASPLLSAAFHDEPTINAANRMGIDVSPVGNHEFDEGWRELRRMQRGGCLPDGDGKDNQNSCPDPKAPFKGARFQYLAANVIHKKSGKTLFPGYWIKKVDGVKIGFIGTVTKETPDIVTKAGVKGLKFTDEVKASNKLVPVLRKKGVRAIVALTHEGGQTSDPTAYNDCPGLTGPIKRIARNLHPEIDAVLSAHTHEAYNCRIRDPKNRMRVVTSAASFGRLITDLHLLIDPRTKDVKRRAAYAENKIVQRNVERKPAITRLLGKHLKLVKPIASEVIGSLEGTDSLSLEPDDAGESALGNAIADAQRADPSVVSGGKEVDIALMNPGGIRADLVAKANGDVTYGAAFTVQPFNNYDVSMDLSGKQVLAVLEQQFTGENAQEPKVLQVSGITYTWDEAAEPGSKIVADSVEVGGEPIDEGATYRVVVNSFLADGGDGFGVLADGKDRFFGGLDIDALSAYLKANSPYAPPATDRISVE